MEQELRTGRGVSEAGWMWRARPEPEAGLPTASAGEKILRMADRAGLSTSCAMDRSGTAAGAACCRSGARGRAQLRLERHRIAGLYGRLRQHDKLQPRRDAGRRGYSVRKL